MSNRIMQPFLSALALGLAASLLAPPAALADQDALATNVLDQARTAMHGAAWASIRYERAKMHVSTSGLSGPAESLYDMGTGAYRNTFDFGVTKGADGYDGKTVWSQDDSGQVAPQGGDNAIKGAVNASYLNAHGYWRTDMPAEITSAGVKKDGKRAFDVVRITPRGGRPFEMWFDARTHILDRTVEQGARETNTVLYGDWRRVSGGPLEAYHVRLTNGEVKYDTDVVVDSITFEDSAPPDVFSPPPPPRPDFGFKAAGARSATVPFTLINNHMYVKVMLNGKGPYELLFDTGGSNLVTPTVAAALGLKAAGAMQGGGVGAKSEDVGLAKVARMEIGDAYLDNQSFGVIALESFGAIEGRPITGIFGYKCSSALWSRPTTRTTRSR